MRIRNDEVGEMVKIANKALNCLAFASNQQLNASGKYGELDENGKFGEYGEFGKCGKFTNFASNQRVDANNKTTEKAQQL